MLITWNNKSAPTLSIGKKPSSSRMDDGGADKYNHFEWTTTKSNLQDVDVVISWILPSDFISFTNSPLSVLYQTATGLNTQNKLDVNLYDTTGTAVALTGGSNLSSLGWTDANITFGGSPTFTPGGTVTLVIKLSATNAGASRVSDVIFNYNGS